MRALRPAIAAFIVALATPAGAALPQLSLACGSAPAGQDVPCSISRVSGGKGVYVLFQTSDDTAKAGTDYTAVSKQVYLSAGTSSFSIAVHTLANANAAGTLTFNAAVAGGSSVVRAIGSIVEPAPVPAPTPTPTPLPGPTGEAAITDNFDTAAGIEQTWYGPLGRGGIAPASADPVGAFRLFCGAGQLLKDDPLVYPGQPGVSHLHQFFGNLGANASSNYTSLRTTGDSTCDIGSVPENRSAYWMPAMMDGADGVVKPNWLKVYYKRNPKSDPMCKPPELGGIGNCTDLPNGIRFVFGYNMKTGVGGPNDLSSQDSGAITYQCWATNDGAPGFPGAGYYHNIEEVRAAGCPSGALLMIIAAAPICWDGVNVDSADHRSHMRMADGPMYAGQFFRACPTTHPYLIDSLEVQAAFRTDANFVAGKWHLSSDEMVPNAVPGATWHMDYWEAWSPTVKATWHANCINLKLSGSGGDQCNGTQIIGANGPPWPQDFPDHVVVPAP
jgi:hypothetical protein